MFDSTPEKERRAAIEDLFWALMTSREFLFQHRAMKFLEHFSSQQLPSRPLPKRLIFIATSRPSFASTVSVATTTMISKENSPSKTFQLLMKGGENGPPIKAGDRAESLLAKVITKQAKPHMPPRREPQLSPAQVDTLLRWIDQGAKPPADDRSILANLNVPDIEAGGNALSPVTRDGHWQKRATRNQPLRRSQIGDKMFDGISGKVNAIAISPDKKRWLLPAAPGAQRSRHAVRPRNRRKTP